MSERFEMVLLPMPLTPQQLQVQERQYRVLLKESSIEEIADRQLDALYGWEAVDDPVTRRLYRNTTLVYARSELQALFVETIRWILGDDDDDDKESV